MTPNVSWPNASLRQRLRIAAMIGIWGAVVAAVTLPWVVTDPYDPPKSYDLRGLIMVCSFSAMIGFIPAFLAGLAWAPTFCLAGKKGLVLAVFSGVGVTLSAVLVVVVMFGVPSGDWYLIPIWVAIEIVISPVGLLVWVCGLVAVRLGARAVAPLT